MVNFFRCLLAMLLFSVMLFAQQSYGASTKPLSSEYNACIAAANGVTAEMLRCLNSELERQNSRLDRAMRSIMESPRISAQRKRELASEQKEWEVSRNQQCLATAKREVDGGSLQSVVARDCAVSKTADRATQLESIPSE